MKELIKVNEKGLVSARELYLGLGMNKTQWSRWSKSNIVENEFFLENTDWVGFDMMSSGNKLSDYAISLEFAKHIAMMSKTEKSHKYRNYFIQCEKQFKNNNQLQLQNADITKQIAEIVQAQLKEQLYNQAEMVDTKYSYYIRPTALTKRSISDYIKRRLGISVANDEYELVKRRIMIMLNAKQWQDIPMEKLQNSLNMIDECIDVVKKDRPFQQQSLF